MTTGDTRAAGYAEEVRAAVRDLRAWAAEIEPQLLHAAPTDGEWTVMQNLVHVVEFLPYWVDQAHLVAERPGQPFGRTHEDPDRIAGVEDHGGDRIEDVLPALEEVAEYAERRLADLEDEAFSATGIHENKGEMTLQEIVEFFITDHLRAHVEQAQAALRNVSGPKMQS